jgi:predicted small secreted protein
MGSGLYRGPKPVGTPSAPRLPAGTLGASPPPPMNYLHRPTLIALGISFVLILLFSGCNTARGFGQDVETAGHHIEKAAR